MAEIAVVIIDPEKQRWAQLLEDQALIGNLLPTLVRKLELPEKLNYELLNVKSKMVLADKDTLAGAGVLPGAELLLRPVRDTLLKMMLDKLYDEAKDYVKDQAWDMAKDRLKTILGLDPKFPDPANLRKVVEDGIAAARAAAEAATTAGKGAAKAAKQAPPRSTAQEAAKTAGRKGCSSGCVIAGVVAAGAVVVIGGIVAVASIVLPLVLDSPLTPFQDVVLGTGDVQITLRWDSSADLDLHVIDPWQEEIYYSHRTSESGGELDVDANRGCATQSYSPVENVYWPAGAAPSGRYTVSVVDYSDCSETSYSSFEVIVTLDGRVYGTYPGQLFGSGQRQTIVSFDW